MDDRWSCSQIAGCSAQRQRVWAQPPRDQPAVGEITGAEHQVVAVFNHIDQAVGQVQIHLHIGILLHVGHHRRPQRVHAEGDRRTDPQPAHRSPARDLGQLLGTLHFFQDDPGTSQVRLPEVGQALLARGAVEQAHAQMLLQRLHMLADQLRRQVQCVGSGRERANLGHLGEAAQGYDQVHCKLLFSNETPDYPFFRSPTTRTVALCSPSPATGRRSFGDPHDPGCPHPRLWRRRCAAR
ncbi:hypothetical protein D3C71_1222580 [compost metagenome]